jgi:hypothetical protein
MFPEEPTVKTVEKPPIVNLPMGDETLLSEKQAAELFPWSVKTFANKRFYNEGPPYRKVGRNIYYVFGELREFFNQGRVDPKRV